MSNNNSVKLVGNLGADPEVRVNSATGKEFVTISVGVHKDWLKDGVKQERTDWFRCVVNGKLVDEVKGLKKGAFVKIEGEMSTSPRKNAEGVVTHYETFVRPYSVNKIEAKAKAEAEAAAAPAAKSAPAAPAPSADFDDEIPF